MPATSTNRFNRRHKGMLIEVEIEPKFLEPRARLLIDGEVVAEASTWPECTTLRGPGMDVHVQWTWTSKPLRAWVTFDDEQASTDDGEDAREDRPEHDLTPPPGSWAERVATFANNHPNVYASRHVVKATAQAIVGLIGIGAILWGLLPRFDIDIPFPDVDLADWLQSVIPSWVRDILNLPGRVVAWLFGLLPDITIFDGLIDRIRSWGFPPDWLRPIVSNARYWIPILIAVLVAIEEVNRRSTKNDDPGEENDSGGDAPPEGDDTTGSGYANKDATSSPPTDAVGADAATERTDALEQEPCRHSVRQSGTNHTAPDKTDAPPDQAG